MNERRARLIRQQVNSECPAGPYKPETRRRYYKRLKRAWMQRGKT